MVMYYKKPPKTRIVLVTPEIGDLRSSNLGELANLLSGKGGGLGDVAAAMFTGLREAGADVSLLAPNFKKIYQKNSGLNEQEWRVKRHTTDPKGIDLVGSKYIENANSIYGNKDFHGNDLDLLICSRFQENARHSIKHIESKRGGRIIVDFQDFVGSGVLSAYLKSRNIANIQTIHNTHTKVVPLDYFGDVDLDSFVENLVCSWFGENRKGVDLLATSIKNASYVKFVGKEFARRIYSGELDDDVTINNSVISEVKQKNLLRRVVSVPNSVSSAHYPENQDIPRIFSEVTGDILEAKKINKLALQKKLGLKEDENALLFVSTSRLDPYQKGVQHFSEVMSRLVNKHDDVQFVVIGDASPSFYSEVVKENIIHSALASNGKIAYAPFGSGLCPLVYAAGTDSFGASHKEPFGQNDVVGIINGGTATNNDVDGYKDKISNISFEQINAIKDSLKGFSEPVKNERALKYVGELKKKGLFGNGFLFNGSDPVNLFKGLEASIRVNRYFRDNLEIGNAHARIRMVDAKSEYGLDKMINRLIDLYTLIEKEKVDKGVWKSY